MHRTGFVDTLNLQYKNKIQFVFNRTRTRHSAFSPISDEEKKAGESLDVTGIHLIIYLYIPTHENL